MFNGDFCNDSNRLKNKVTYDIECIIKDKRQ